MLCSDCSRPVRPVVALDIDGTLAQYHKQFVTFAATYLNRYDELVRWLTYDGSKEMSDFMELPKETYRQIKLAYRQGGNKRWMEPFKEAAGFVMLVRELDVELWITTTRPWQRLDNIDPDTQEWLRRNAILHHGLIYDEEIGRAHV